MTPEVFAIWAEGAPVNEVIQVCHESRFTNDLVVRALVALLERGTPASAEGMQLDRLQEAHSVGVRRMADAAEEMLDQFPDDTPVSDIRGAFRTIDDELGAAEFSVNDMTFAALAAEGFERPKPVRPAGSLRGIYQPEILNLLREAETHMSMADVVKAVNHALNKTGSRAVYEAIRALRLKKLIELTAGGILRIKGDVRDMCS